MVFDLKILTAAVSDDEVCGPDLDMEGDADYMRFSARVEGLLPKSFSEFDRGAIEFEKEFATIDDLLTRSRDLRLLVFRAKLSILNRDAAGFLASLAALESLLGERWEAVHPQLLDGDPLMRVIALQTLDDMPDTVLPLQQLPLFTTRRFGPVSYRTFLLSEGKVAPRKATTEGGEDERKPSAADLRAAVNDADTEKLVQARDWAAGLQATLEQIETSVSDRSGQPLALRFDNVKPLAKDIAIFLDTAVASRDPSLALAKPAEETGPVDESIAEGVAAAPVAPSAPVGSIRTHGAAQRALNAAAVYFNVMEPSSLVRPLIKQAEALIGKSFFDVIQTLVPDYAGRATIRVVRDLPLTLTIEQMSALPDFGADISNSDSPPAAEPGKVSIGQTSRIAVDGSKSPSEEADLTIFSASSRQEALALIDQVSGYFRIAEPSSPVPALLDHARTLGGRDFFALLRDVLPKAALRVDE